jgi:membrane protein
MSEPKGARDRPGGRRPIRFAPFLAAMAAMAAATILPRLGLKRRPAPPPQDALRPLTPAELDALEPGRGRCARSPLELPLLGWKDILWRAWRKSGRDRLAALSGGITYYLLLATFPAIAAFVSLYGLFSDVNGVERQLSHLSSILPADAVSLIGDQMKRIAEQKHATLSAAFGISTLLSVWSANAGMKAMFDAVNIAFGETEKRDYLRRSLITYASTLALLVCITLAVSALIAAPVFLHDMGIRHFGALWGPIRWLTVFLIGVLAFTLLYRYAPSRRPAQWRWVAFGGALAAFLWLAISLAFSWYVNHVANFGVTYGSLGAMVAYMIWMWVSAMVVLAGAELNSEIEHQTAVDTTIGPVKPIGERGAVMADTVGRAFTVSPEQAVQISAGFARRQVRYVIGFLRRIARVPLL